MILLARQPLKTLLKLGVLLLLAVAGYCGVYLVSPLEVSTLPAEVEIPRGAGFRSAVMALEKSGVRLQRRQFELLARAMGRSRDIKAGNYQLVERPTPLELLQKLTRGDVMQAEVRLIEGWTFGQFRAMLNASPDLRHDTASMEDLQILSLLKAEEQHPEGLFFPDTYLFARGSSDLAVLRHAYHAMQRHLRSEWKAREAGVPYRSQYEALIMASIIEKETGLAAERDLIAGALVNRLRI
ncbi:MAG TPA: endolytic transglycosylase MltG, partial [Burkholderiales bacterium]|nr:endolytic transglycosylase MltG [Burkholderiales bacterium]